MIPDDVIYDHDDAKFYFLHTYTLSFPSVISSTSYEPHTMQKDKYIKDYGIIGGDALKSFILKAVTGTTMFPPGFLWSRKEWWGILRDFSLSGCFLLLCTARLHVSHPCYRIIFSTELSGTTGESLVRPAACPSEPERSGLYWRSIDQRKWGKNASNVPAMGKSQAMHHIFLLRGGILPKWGLISVAVSILSSSMHMLQFK